MSQLILLIGLPGSGKSTLANKLLAECPQKRLISTDAIRGQLFGNEDFQGSWVLIWQEIKRQFQETVDNKSDAIYDATNAQRRSRKEIITLAKEIGFTQIKGIWINTPIDVCILRNKSRLRVVPEEVISRMHRRLEDAPPHLDDGFDELTCLDLYSTQS
jgi:predicted kinase